MHVAVFADMEGSFGIWRMRQCKLGTPQWQYGRECLTADVNAVIQGAFNGGADRVSVKDTHETGFNCILRKLDRRVHYNGGPYVRPTIFGKIPHYDLILYVGIHAGAGTEQAFFAHTHFAEFSEILINDRRICEMELYAGCFGDYGIPLGFVSGEDIAVDQARSVMPWLRFVTVEKKKGAYTSGASSLEYITRGREKLREEACEAVKHIKDMKLLEYSKPLHFKAVYASEEKARKYNSWGFKRTGAAIEWESDTMTDGYNTINKVSWFPKKTYAILPMMLFLYRRYYRIKNNYFPPEANPDGAVIL